MKVTHIIASFPRDTELAGAIKDVNDKLIVAHKDNQILVLIFGRYASTIYQYYWSCPHQLHNNFDGNEKSFFTTAEIAIRKAIEKGWNVEQITID